MNVTQTVTVRGTEARSAAEAVQYAEAGGGQAISLGGRYFRVTHRELDRLETSGLKVDCWFDRKGRVVCVPA